MFPGSELLGMLSLVETLSMRYGFRVILFLVSPWKGWLFKPRARWFSHVYSFPNSYRRSRNAALPLPVRNEVWFPFLWVQNGLWPGWPPQVLCVGTGITSHHLSSWNDDHLSRITCWAKKGNHSASWPTWSAASWATRALQNHKLHSCLEHQILWWLVIQQKPGSIDINRGY